MSEEGKIETRSGCLIWPHELHQSGDADYYPKSNGLTIVDSKRVGAKYSFDKNIEDLLNERLEQHKRYENQMEELGKQLRNDGTEWHKSPRWIELNEQYYVELQFRARLTTIILERFQNTKKPVQITTEMLEEAKTRNNKSLRDRAERLLTYFSTIEIYAGQLIHIPDNGVQFYESMAHSESIDPGDRINLCNHLIEKNLLKKMREDDDRYYRITVEGHEYLYRSSIDSKRVFVAMPFNKSFDAVYYKAIKPAIEECGYKPVRIDLKHDVNKIADEIISEIKRSRFVIADMTPDPDTGVRGSVYFEAGFAMGQKIDVIFLCKKNYIKDIHFDTRQYYHIEYEDSKMNDLKKNLVHRINARIKN